MIEFDVHNDDAKWLKALTHKVVQPECDLLTQVIHDELVYAYQKRLAVAITSNGYATFQQAMLLCCDDQYGKAIIDIAMMKPHTRIAHIDIALHYTDPDAISEYDKAYFIWSKQLQEVKCD